MNEISEHVFLVSLAIGAIILLVATGRYFLKGDTSIIVLLAGIALVALPVVKSMKVTGSGLELQVKDLRSEIAAVGLQVERVKRAELADERPTKVDAEILKEPITLVFFSDAAEESVRDVVTKLNANGFVAKGISTDFSELGSERKDFQRNEAYVKYAPGYRANAEAAKDVISSQGFSAIRLEEVKKFSSGDIQIGLF